MHDDRELLEATGRVLDACADQPMDDRLLILQFAWITLAQQARNEALGVRGGFPAQQAKQLEQLYKIAQVVKSDAPDLELERLIQEGDIEGALQHMRKRIGDLRGGGA
jgi:hypothetical protein